MSRKRKSTVQTGISTAARVKRTNKRLPRITIDDMVELVPLTKNQELLFDEYDKGQNIVAHGFPGTGKTLTVLYKALEEVLDPTTPYEKVIVVRSVVPTRDMGFLKGSVEDKQSEYEKPYKYMIKNLFNFEDDERYELLYGELKAQKSFYFMSTSFIRGMTFDDCIIIIDELENLSSHELDSIITRIGHNCKMHFAGDLDQSDLTKQTERKGAGEFLSVLRQMKEFTFIDFQIEDIVRSDIVKNYIIQKNILGLKL